MPMPLLGSSRRAVAATGKPQPAPSQYDPTGEGLQAPRRGLFGGVRRAFGRNPDGDPLTPDFWQLMLYGDNATNVLAERENARMRRGLFGQQMRSAKDQQLQAQQEQSARQRSADAVEQYIGTLPPEQQVQARMAYAVNPEAFAESVAQQMSGGGWQVGQGYSHTFRTRPDGTVERGDPLPLRPRAPIQGYYSPNDGAVYMDELPEDLR